MEFFEKFFRASLRQKIVDKFTKLSKISFPMECFIVDIWQFSSTDVKIYLLGTDHQIQVFHGFAWNFLFPNVPLLYSVFVDNNLPPFHFW